MPYEPKQRIVEEWKVNVDLLKWHDGLKQRRFLNFITIEVAVFGGYAIALDYVSKHPQFGVYLYLIAFVGWAVAVAAFFWDVRAAQYLQIVTRKLRKLEKPPTGRGLDIGLRTIEDQIDQERKYPPSWLFVFLKSVDETREGLCRFPINPPAAVVERWVIILIVVIWSYVIYMVYAGLPAQLASGPKAEWCLSVNLCL